MTLRGRSESVSTSKQIVNFNDTEITVGGFHLDPQFTQGWDVRHDGRFELRGNASFNATENLLQFAAGEKSKRVFSGTADQTISLPNCFSETEWIVDKPAGKLNLVQFDGYLQGRVTNLRVGPACRVDLSGPAPYLRNSENWPAYYYGLYADTVSAAVMNLEMRHKRSLKSCENYGVIRIPQDKELWAEAFQNHSGAVVENESGSKFWIHYEGLENDGSVTNSEQIKYFDAPSSVSVTLNPNIIRSHGHASIEASIVVEHGEDDSATILWADQHDFVQLQNGVGKISRIHDGLAPGTYTVQVDARDTNGELIHGEATLTVVYASAPLASLGLNVTSGNAPLSLGAYATSASVGVEMEIDWGDGSTTGRIPLTHNSFTHVYYGSGQYKVKLTVWNEIGETSTTSPTVTVRTAPPRATLSVSPTKGTTPLTVTAKTTGSVGTKMEIDWGDGTSTGVVDLKSQISHEYTKAGEFTVTLRIGNEEDAWEEATKTVVVEAVPPPRAVLSISPRSGEAPLTVTATTTGSVGTKMEIDWGDGTSTGVVELQNQISHEYVKAGEFIVTLRVGNEEDAWDEATSTAIVGLTSQISHEYTKAGEFIVTLRIGNEEEEWDEATRMVVVTACTPPTTSATIYSRFNRLVLAKTSLGKGGMA